MVTLKLDGAREQRLRELAESRGQDLATFARTVLEDFVDFEIMPPDSEEEWAEASAQLAGEVFGE